MSLFVKLLWLFGEINLRGRQGQRVRENWPPVWERDLGIRELERPEKRIREWSLPRAACLGGCHSKKYVQFSYGHCQHIYIDTHTQYTYTYNVFRRGNIFIQKHPLEKFHTTKMCVQHFFPNSVAIHPSLSETNALGHIFWLWDWIFWQRLWPKMILRSYSEGNQGRYWWNMMKIRCLSNGLYSLKNCHKQFGQAFWPPHPPFGQCPNLHGFFLAGASLTLLLSC